MKLLGEWLVWLEEREADAIIIRKIELEWREKHAQQESDA